MNSYIEANTVNVKPYHGYEKDFKNVGEFVEEAGDQEEKVIFLTCGFFPGLYNGTKWEQQTTPGKENESYLIHINYRNKNHIDILFDAVYSKKPSAQKSFNLVKRAAKKFFLKNAIFQFLKTPDGWNTKPPTWSQVQNELIRTATILELADIRYGQSWVKTMTVKEAKQLFKFLKIIVHFPK